MRFQVVCTVGHRLGLEKALKGMGLAGKTEGVSGALAPGLWAQGQYQKVLDYVANDVIQPLQLAEVVEREHSLRWISNSGKKLAMPVASWLTVKECLELPLPDTSWMSHAERREDYLAWMPKEVLAHVG